MSKSLFKKDRALEEQLNKKILAEFAKLGADIQYPLEGVNEYDALTDKSGIDAIFSSSQLIGTSGYKNIDLKSATSWIADFGYSGLATFAFELSFINDIGQVRDGWLFGEKYAATEYYSLQWLWKKEGVNTRYVSDVNEIGKVETLIISKEAVQNYAQKLNVTEYNYRNLSSWLASKTEDCRSKKEKSNTKLVVNTAKKRSELILQPTRSGQQARLLCSHHLAERPVNLLIPKKDLVEMASPGSHLFYEI